MCFPFDDLSLEFLAAKARSKEDEYNQGIWLERFCQLPTEKTLILFAPSLRLSCFAIIIIIFFPCKLVSALPWRLHTVGYRYSTQVTKDAALHFTMFNVNNNRHNDGDGAGVLSWRHSQLSQLNLNVLQIAAAVKQDFMRRICVWIVVIAIALQSDESTYLSDVREAVSFRGMQLMTSSDDAQEINRNMIVTNRQLSASILLSL